MCAHSVRKEGGADIAVTGNGRTGLPWLKIVGFGLLIAVVVLGVYLIRSGTLGPTHLTGEAIADYVKSLGLWGHLAIVAIMIVHSFLPFPAEIVAIAAGMSYGAAWGATLVWIGAMLGAWLAFGLARLFGRPLVEELTPARHKALLDRWSRESSTSTLIVVRLIPVIAFNLVNYAAGLTRVTWWTFTWTTALGILPMTILMVVLGEQMREPALMDWAFLVGAGVLIAIVAHIARRHGMADAGDQ